MARLFRAWAFFVKFLLGLGLRLDFGFFYNVSISFSASFASLLAFLAFLLHLSDLGLVSFLGRAQLVAICLPCEVEDGLRLKNAKREF